MKSIRVILILSLTSIIISFILASAFNNRFQSPQTVKVTGMAKRDFVADIIVWDAFFTARDMILEEAYKELDKDRDLITDYFKSKSIHIDDVVFTSISIKKDYEYKYDRDGIKTQEFSGYILSQGMKVESFSVEQIEDISRDITSLIVNGVEIQSAKPYYFYSKLADLKLDMIAEASEDAKKRVESIINSTECEIGELISANMGVFQIVAKHSTEGYSWGGTHNKTSKQKTASITMKLNYGIN